jgi:heme/copper-type cytochrome/quinol oxidase subunit 3
MLRYLPRHRRKMQMSAVSKQTRPGRLWKVPTSRTRWYWLCASALLFLGIVAWYLYAHQTQQYTGPLTDPLRLFGILAFVLVLSTATYSLRRRFFKSLPGKVQDWLWMHTWIGIITILIAMMHEDFGYITHDYCQDASCLTNTYFAGSALFTLIMLVISGIVGRLLDIWSTHRIARDANANGVGIAQTLIARIKELDYTIERLCAGKSTAFKQFCEYAQESHETDPVPAPSRQALPGSEHADMEKAYQMLQQRAQLLVSLKRQQHATSLMRIWRYVHMTIATIALLAISYHAVMELLTNVWNLLPPQ